MDIIALCSENHTDNIHAKCEGERGNIRHVRKIANGNYYIRHVFPSSRPHGTTLFQL